MTTVEFVKLSGSGNDFLCIDNRGGAYDELLAAPQRIAHFARMLCSRGLGIGADGVILACTPDIEGVSDIAARFYEPDGSVAELCGNGTACFIRWVVDSGWTPAGEIRILTPAGIVRGCVCDDNYVRVCVPTPEDTRTDLNLMLDGTPWKCDFAVVGVPHAVTYVEDVKEVDVEHWGKALRHHCRFRPRGANANFVQIIGPGELALRTWEFGVEGETLACGTGSAAAAILAAARFGWPTPRPDGGKPVLVHAAGGDLLRIYFEKDDAGIHDVCLETVVRFLCTGTMHPDLIAAAWDIPAGAEQQA